MLANPVERFQKLRSTSHESGRFNHQLTADWTIISASSSLVWETARQKLYYNMTQFHASRTENATKLLLPLRLCNGAAVAVAAKASTAVPKWIWIMSRRLLTSNLAFAWAMNICWPMHKTPIHRAKTLSCCRLSHFCNLQPSDGTIIPMLLYRAVHPSANKQTHNLTKEENKC